MGKPVGACTTPCLQLDGCVTRLHGGQTKTRAAESHVCKYIFGKSNGKTVGMINVLSIPSAAFVWHPPGADQHVAGAISTFKARQSGSVYAVGSEKSPGLHFRLLESTLSAGTAIRT